MDVWMIADIFGVSEALASLGRAAFPDARVRVLDPFGGERQTFSDENAAYRSFVEACGHDRYAWLVRQWVETFSEPAVLVGFSAGASAAWRALDGYRGGTVRHFLGFYPTQIRHHLGISAHVPTTLVFPAMERHFDVAALQAELAARELVTCIATSYAHGFMNPLSPGFSPEGHGRFQDEMGRLVGWA